MTFEFQTHQTKSLYLVILQGNQLEIIWSYEIRFLLLISYGYDNLQSIHSFLRWRGSHGDEQLFGP